MIGTASIDRLAVIRLSSQHTYRYEYFALNQNPEMDQ
jgi:hypothetical protein